MTEIEVLQKRLDNYRNLCITQNVLIEQLEQIILDQQMEIDHLCDDILEQVGICKPD